MKTNQNIPISFDPSSKNQAEINQQLTEIIRQLWLRVNANEKEISNLLTQINNITVNQQTYQRKVITTDYTISQFDDIIEIDTTANPITITLIPFIARKFIYFKHVQGLNTYTFDYGAYGFEPVVLPVDPAVTPRVDWPIWWNGTEYMIM